MTDNNKVLVFAGTTEGRLLTEYLAKAKVYVHACVITDYGKQLIEKGEFVEVSSNRLGMEGMCQLMKEYPV
ncbi:MAG: precorrin-6A/cobalt-precorrin-6A reductase, partial [Candidatus Methanomethylophilaceae archaeon]|nr:precorrin-6A/cobalt-precorrin-6A reductase [Candidatus Methanomethylophilaceae archaeon]